MSDVEDLRNSVKKELECYDSFLSLAKDIMEAVPQVHEWREEAKAKWVALDHMPDNVLRENASGLLAIQRDEQEARQELLPSLPKMPLISSSVHITSGSTAVFYESVVRMASMGSSPPSWLPPISQAFDALAASKVHKATLPGLLAEVRPNLSEMFSIANASVDQARSSIIGPDQAIVRMRDVVEQLWGALTGHATRKCKDTVRAQNLELKKAPHRHIVADCLSTAESGGTLSTLLDDLYSLHHDLSPESKRLLEQSTVKLEELHTRWILLVDAIVKSVKP
jgi:hypothetical protein